MYDANLSNLVYSGSQYTITSTFLGATHHVFSREARHPARGGDPYGPGAAAYTTARLTGATVRRDLDPAGDDTDAYGRLLRYVVLANGKNFSETLLHRGLATAIRTFHYARQREFLQLEAQACAEGDGPTLEGAVKLPTALAKQGARRATGHSGPVLPPV